MNSQTKNRLMLIAVVLLFAAPMFIAFVLNQSGWRPAKTRNYGTLVEPARGVSAVAVTLSDGSRLNWSDPQWHWTLLAFGGDRCAAACTQALAALMRMRLTLGRNAERLRVVYLGPALPPEAGPALAPLLVGSVAAGGVLAAYRPDDGDALALALVDPNGRLLLRHPAGFDVARVREDLVKVVH